MIIRKLGYIDSARSHVQGLLPYVLPDNQISFPWKTDGRFDMNANSNGNFGQYVCDFGREEGAKNREIARLAGTDSINEGETFVRFRHLDFVRSYTYAKKQIREGIVVKKVTRDVIVDYDCDGKAITESRVIWTDKLSKEDIVEPYDYMPLNFYGIDENGHRTIPNYKKEGNYGFIFINAYESEPELNGKKYGLLVGISRNNDEMFPNQDKIYKRDDNDNIYWEYPDTAGKIINDSWRWGYEFGAHFSWDNEQVWTICRDMEEYFIGYLTIPQTIEGDLVPDRISYSDIPKWIKWFDTHTKDSCCYEKVIDGENSNVGNVVDKEWIDRGGDEMKEFLKGKDSLLERAVNIISTTFLKFLVPNMEYPLLITDEYRETGLWSEYVDEENPDGISLPIKSLESTWKRFNDGEDEPIMVESQLQSVRSDIYHSDDNGVLPGLFDIDGGYYKCRYRNYWEYKEYANPSDTEKNNAVLKDSVPATGSTRFDDYIIKVGEGDDEKYYKEDNIIFTEVFGIGAPSECHDDYTAANNDSYYFAATVVEEAVPILNTLVPLKEGRGLVDLDFVNLLAKFKSPIKIPYTVGEVHNFYKDENGNCYGDYVTDIRKTDSQIIITYNIGGKCNPDGSYAPNSGYGILLEDTYSYSANHSYNCSFEDYPTTINGEYIDFDSNTKDVENYDLGTTEADENGDDVFVPKIRKCNQARLIGMRVMDALDGLTPKVMFKQPEADGVDFSIKSEVDIELNRGASAAFENYFKLGECNTMSDLENYQNNWFNL